MINQQFCIKRSVICLFIVVATASVPLFSQEILPIPSLNRTAVAPATVDPGSLGSLALINEGARLLAAGNSLEAESVLGRSVVANPQSPEAMYNFGLALGFNNKFAEAVQAQLKAIELKAQFPEAFLALGNMYQSLDENEQALAAYEQAHQLAHNEHVRRSALFNKGNVLGRLERYLEAEMALSECLAVDPSDTSAAFALANLHLRQGNYEMALGWLDSVSNEYRLEKTFLRCQLQMKLKNRIAAAQAYEEARKILDESTTMASGHRTELSKGLDRMAKELSMLR